MNANAKRNKVIGLIGMIVLSIVITCGVNKQYTFGAGFITEDMTEAYHDYAFHWKWFFLSLVMSLPLAVIVGGIVALI